MSLTYEDKIALAKQLRSTSMIKSCIRPEYEKFLELVSCEERLVPTREGDAHVYLITPKCQKKIYPLYINIHGGGFVRGYSKKDTLFCSMIAAKLACRVIDIDYKLAPEHPFPTALNECYDIVKWAFDCAGELSVDKGKIAVGGHSSGGNLTAGIALIANQSKDFDIKLQILDYPFLDAVTDPAEKLTGADIFPVERLRAFDALYMENEEDKFNPFVSLVYAEQEMLKGLPPALVITAGVDCLRLEGEKYAMMLAKAGVKVKVKRFLNSHHGFIVYCMEEFTEAQSLIVDTLAQAFYG